MNTKEYQPKTSQPCHCKRGQQRDNCPDCEGTGMRIDFKAIRERPINPVHPTRETVAKFDYRYTLDTIQAAEKLNTGPIVTVDEAAHRMGMRQGEPIIIMLDCLLQYALVYKVRFEGFLCDDYVLGKHWLEAIKNIRGLLNGDGVVAMQRGITTDSKSNGACEDVFWKAMQAAGFGEDEL